MVSESFNFYLIFSLNLFSLGEFLELGGTLAAGGIQLGGGSVPAIPRDGKTSQGNKWTNLGGYGEGDGLSMGGRIR